MHLQCDYSRLSQVITNLINNAIKFTTSGEIRYGFEPQGDMIECFVSDTGIGIPERERKMIFERFVKLNSHATGTGLGLAITKMIVEKIGGTIGVESEVNRGTTFRFTVPAGSSKHSGNPAAADPAPEGLQTEAWPSVHETAPAPEVLSVKPLPEEVFSSAGSGDRPSPAPSEEMPEDLPTVLIAEDIDSNYMLMKAFIGKRYKLLWAHNGQEAVELFERYRPQLIFMDIKMPIMDGYEATKAIRRLSSDVPILAITAFAFESDRQKAMDVGCNDYITKPISRQILNEKLSFYLG